MFEGKSEINLDRKGIDDERAKEIAAELERNSTATVIAFAWNKIGTEGAIAIAAAIKANSTCTDINLMNNNIGDGGAIAIAAAIKVNSTLTAIRLGGNNISNDGVIAIANAIKVNSTITHIGLHKNNIGHEGAIAIAAAIETNCTLISIDLFANNIGDEGAIAIAAALEVNCALTRIELSANKIGYEARKVFGAALVAHKEKITAIQRIDYKTLIKSQDTSALTNALATSKILYLYGTKISIDDIKKITAALANNDTITTIRLVNNHIDDDGVKKIATALAANNTVLTLDLMRNEISDDGVVALTDMLITNKNLTTIKLSSNSIGDDGAKKISTALATNKTITTVDLTHNGISNDGAWALADVFLTNKTLKYIDLSGNKGSDEYSSIVAARSDPRMWAISYEQLVKVRDLAMKLFGEEFYSKTMRDVNEMIIIPLCQLEKKSYSLSKNLQGCKTEVFVSHSWDQLFGEFVDCIIKSYSKKLRKPNLWICAFALLQGMSGEVRAQLGTRETPLDQSPFVRALKGASHYLVVRNRNIDLCERIWCICEFIYAKEFELIPNKTLVTGPDTFVDKHNSCVDAESFDPNDKEKIMTELTTKISISDIDAHIREFRSFENFEEGKTNDDVILEVMTQTDKEGKLLSGDNVIRKQVGELTKLKRENDKFKVENDKLKGEVVELTELKTENELLRGEIEKLKRKSEE